MFTANVPDDMANACRRPQDQALLELPAARGRGGRVHRGLYGSYSSMRAEMLALVAAALGERRAQAIVVRARWRQETAEHTKAPEPLYFRPGHFLPSPISYF